MATGAKTTTLFSLGVFKTWLKGQGIDSSEDDRYRIAADAATAEIERELDVFFVQRTVTEIFSGDNKCDHVLNYAPAAITAFTIDGVAVDPSTYVLDEDSGVITFTSGIFTAGVKNVSITYTAGFDVQDGSNLPGDIYRAALDLAKAIYDELATNAIAATSVSLGPATMVIKAAKRPPSVQRVIDSWSGTGMRP